jgi:CheY-like chemotaxis protein
LAAAKVHDNRALRVLVVEDNAGVADSWAGLLETLGHEVEVVRDGLDALRAAEAEPPDLVLLDLGLPGMSGYEVARRLRGRRRSKRPLIIAITGFGQDAERLRSYEVGIDLHLVKPVQFDELANLLARYQAVTG